MFLVFKKTLNQHNICKGYKATRIWPLNVDVMADKMHISEILCKVWLSWFTCWRSFRGVDYSWKERLSLLCGHWCFWMWSTLQRFIIGSRDNPNNLQMKVALVDLIILASRPPLQNNSHVYHFLFLPKAFCRPHALCFIIRTINKLFNYYDDLWCLHLCTWAKTSS